MGSGAGEGQHKDIVVFFVHQKPVWGDMALSVPEPFSFQLMVSVTRRQRCARSSTASVSREMLQPLLTRSFRSFLKRAVGLTSYIGKEGVHHLLNVRVALHGGVASDSIRLLEGR